MTTNVLDMQSLIMTTDSRWSAEDDNFIFYLDDTKYDKIVIDDDTAFMFAGAGSLIQEWKEKIADETIFCDELNYGEGDITIDVCIVDMGEKEIMTAKGGIPLGGVAHFAGTGMYHALRCWTKNNCAKTAVKTAIENDNYSGGDVKFIEFESRVNNINDTNTIDDVRRELNLRGIVMNRKDGTKIGKINNGNIIPFGSEESANDADNLYKAQSFVNDVTSGKIPVTAPCASMYVPWTEDEKAELSSALKKIFAKKQAKREKMALA